MIDRKTQKNLKIACPACEQRLDTSGLPAFEEVACPTCGLDIIVPYRFGQYLLEEPLRESNVSGVYRALDLKLDREVCIKVLDARLAQDEQILESFLRLGRRVAALNHPNIVSLYSSGEYEHLPFLVMEFMPQLSVAERLADAPAGLDAQVALSICHDCIRGLDAAKREGLLHHDLKPSNILLGEAGVVKITDFGMSDVTDPGRDHGVVRRRLDARYASPELLSDQEADSRSDLFSLGAVLYHMLTGRPPFLDDVRDRLRHVDAPVERSPKALRADVPRDVSDFTMQLLSFDPAARPGTYPAALQAVGNHRNAVKPQPQVRRRVSRRLKRTSDKAGMLVRGQSRVLYRRRKGWLYLDAAILALLLALTLILVFAAQSRPGWYVDHIEPTFRWIQQKF